MNRSYSINEVGSKRLGQLHAAGPDEMGRELAAGPEAVAQTLAQIDEQQADLERVMDRAKRVVMVGTGASLAVALAAKPAWQARECRGARRTCLIREATDVALDAADGDDFDSSDVVIAISQSGSSPETLDAARLAVARGAAVIALTAVADSPLARTANLVVHTPLSPETGAATKSALSAYAALLGLIGALSVTAPDRDRTKALLSAVVADWAATQSMATDLAGARNLWILGGGAARGLAQAGALLWHEKVRHVAVPSSPSEFRHGLVEALSPEDAVLFLGPDPSSARARGYARVLGSELQEIGSSVWSTAAPDFEIATRDTSVMLSAPTLPLRLLEALLRLQQLARLAAHVAGTYEDGFSFLQKVVHPIDIEHM